MPRRSADIPQGSAFPACAQGRIAQWESDYPSPKLSRGNGSVKPPGRDCRRTRCQRGSVRCNGGRDGTGCGAGAPIRLQAATTAMKTTAGDRTHGRAGRVTGRSTGIPPTTISLPEYGRAAAGCLVNRQPSPDFLSLGHHRGFPVNQLRILLEHHRPSIGDELQCRMLEGLLHHVAWNGSAPGRESRRNDV